MARFAGAGKEGYGCDKADGKLEDCSGNRTAGAFHVSGRRD